MWFVGLYSIAIIGFFLWGVTGFAGLPMALAIHSPRIKAYRETDGTWTATLWIEGVWHAEMRGFASANEARTAIRRRYL